jgi:hypothetical protein
VLYEWVNRAIFRACLANCAESRLFESNPSENCHNSWKSPNRKSGNDLSLSIRIRGWLGGWPTKELEVQCSTGEQHLLDCAVDRGLKQNAVCA